MIKTFWLLHWWAYTVFETLPISRVFLWQDFSIGKFFLLARPWSCHDDGHVMTKLILWQLFPWWWSWHDDHYAMTTVMPWRPSCPDDRHAMTTIVMPWRPSSYHDDRRHAMTTGIMLWRSGYDHHDVNISKIRSCSHYRPIFINFTIIVNLPKIPL